MSKFKELCAAYSDFREQLSETRADAYRMANSLVHHYLNYLELDDQNAYKLIPLEGKVESGTTYSPVGATHLGDDGHWHLGFRLTLYKNANTHPQQPFKIIFTFIKNENGTYTLSVKELGFSTIISDLKNEREFDPVFDEIQKNILGYYEEGKGFLRGKNSKMSSIGFIQQGIVTTVNSDKSD